MDGRKDVATPPPPGRGCTQTRSPAAALLYICKAISPSTIKRRQHTGLCFQEQAAGESSNASPSVDAHVQAKITHRENTVADDDLILDIRYAGTPRPRATLR